MRRLPGILLLTGATLIVIVALMVSGLRLALPHLNTWRPALLEKISSATGVPVQASHVDAAWQTFGPTLDVRDIRAQLSDGGNVSVRRVTVALDVWQSLLHLRWQFRDLTFYQLQVRTNTPIKQREGGNPLEGNKLSDLFFRQFDHFDLRDSTLSFITISGQRAELAVPQLTWLNGKNRHRAEGQVSLSSLTGQHGVMQVRMDLRDDNGLLNRGTVWMQADDVDVKPWLGQWMKDNVDLTSAQFSLEAWMTLRDGEVEGGDIWLKQGGTTWRGEDRSHRLSVDNLTAHISRADDAWQVAIPQTRVTVDDKPWPAGSLNLAWLAGQPVDGDKVRRSDELRVRASNLELSGLEGFLPLATRLAPSLGEVWGSTRPKGKIDALALDIPLQATDKTRFLARWSDLSWQQWKLLPGAEHFSGSVSGTPAHGQATVNMTDARMPYQTVFRAPLEIARGEATLDWRNDAQGFTLAGKHLDVQAHSLWARGDFRYQQPKNGQPWLEILAGIKTSDAAQAWRYFPENLMGKDLVDYLSGAIQGGQVENATLVYVGNPQHFPYKQNDGQFEVYVPLHNATYAFQPDWPALKDFAINLDFRNDGLWMAAPQVMLGGVTGKNLTAVIPDYSQEKLFIDADIAGPGKAVGPYFKETPLADSLGTTLDELQLDGDVNARLHLDIPLDGAMTTAKGDVWLRNNALFVKPLNSTLHNLNGKFSFVNGNLQSEPLTATWFNQPLNIDFSTREEPKAYQVEVNMNGDWQPTRTGLLPKPMNDALSGSILWNGKVAISLPYHAGVNYQVDITGNLKNVSSHLPEPVEKPAGKALPFKVRAKGDLKSFDVTGNAGAENHFNSRWLLGRKLTLDRAIWASDSRTTPPLPENRGVELNLPAMDGAQWLALFNQGAAEKVSSTTLFPEAITLRTPALTFGGQRWNNLSIMTKPQTGGTEVSAQGREINGRLLMRDGAPWLANIDYLYYNPSHADEATTVLTTPSGQKTQAVDFSHWPNLALRCAECWLWGQKYGRIDGDFTINGDTLSLANGLLDTGFARLTMEGEWVNRQDAMRTSVKGVLKGKQLDAATSFFGVKTPLQGSSFNVDYDLHWRDAPWKPDEASLNGVLHTRLGKGQIADLGTGHAGQLLRLLSFDALLRKLRFDFSDTFGEGFYYDSIRSTVWIKDGIMHTEDTLVDGLEADIAMKGSVNLPARTLDMEAVVAPEISATVGVAAAFAVNPIVGAAVFAASKVLGPLWNKISVLRYHITGPIDKPQINEVMRQPRAQAAQ
ncbi:AsmA2 domain-containing protein YhdP [Cronobacter sakazakii]|nr:AsmA2 domain-containing protein YhdP [Cronobacter sakazakii]ELY3794123.1 AsmA2 domain-containing protein YhdP [Cronobacter sakazakii]ELY3829684.1 AsmA2 domain-containing protein YhdP [Cronobacter sakazakii]ELY4143225.1 AsmA2 domain-containing protein YhdP [Cronobacter sakazakii]